MSGFVLANTSHVSQLQVSLEIDALSTTFWDSASLVALQWPDEQSYCFEHGETQSRLLKNSSDQAVIVTMASLASSPSRCPASFFSSRCYA